MKTVFGIHTINVFFRNRINMDSTKSLTRSSASKTDTNKLYNISLHISTLIVSLFSQPFNHSLLQDKSLRPENISFLHIKPVCVNLRGFFSRRVGIRLGTFCVCEFFVRPFLSSVIKWHQLKHRSKVQLFRMDQYLALQRQILAEKEIFLYNDEGKRSLNV